MYPPAMRALGCSIILVFFACAPAHTSPTTPSLHPSALGVIPVPSPAPAEEACVSPEVEAGLGCRPEDARAAPVSPGWPSAEYLFHYPPRRPWVSPVLPAIGQPSDAMRSAERSAAAGRWRVARDAYAALLKTTPKDDASRAWVHARIAQLSENLGLFDEALAAVLTEKDALRHQPASLGAEALAARLPASFGRAFARSKRAPDDVGTFTDDELESIVDGYDDAMRYDAARTVLGELAKRSDPVKACTYGARQVSTTIEQSPGFVSRLLAAAQEQQKRRKATNGSACRAATLAVTEEMAMAMHLDAVGWNGVRGTGDKRTLDHAAKLYELMLTEPSEGESWPPWFAQEQRPSRARLRFAHAELALFMHDFDKCGFELEDLGEGPEDAGLRAAANAKAAYCFERAMEGRRPTGPMTDWELKFVNASTRALCTVAGDHVALGLARGRVFYRAEQWEKAAGALAEPAFAPGRKEAREAAALYLVSLDRLAGTTRRPTCSERRERDQARLLALHCSGVDDDEPIGPAIAGVTVSGAGRRVTPCEAMRNLGAPPPPLPDPPAKATAPRFIGGDTTLVSGNAVPEVVAWATRLHEAQLRACYDLALERDPFVSGREWLSFTIARDGSVSAARAGSDDHEDAELDACLGRVLGAMSFGQPEGGLVNVRWALTLDRARGAHLSGAASVSQPR